MVWRHNSLHEKTEESSPLVYRELPTSSVGHISSDCESGAVTSNTDACGDSNMQYCISCQSHSCELMGAIAELVLAWHQRTKATWGF